MFSGLDGFLTPCNRKALDNPPAWIYSSSLRGVDSICLPVTNQAVLTQKETRFYSRTWFHFYIRCKIGNLC